MMGVLQPRLRRVEFNLREEDSMGAIQIKTEIPGPCSRELHARREKAVPRGPYNSTPIYISHASGAVVEDVDGNRYLDFAGGIGVLNVGHTHAEVVSGVTDQAKLFTHACFHATPYEVYISLAEKLNALAPIDGDKKTLLVNSGAEGVENAIKIARAHTGRSAVVCFEDAFHGRTLLALSLTSKIVPYKSGFGPFAPEVYRVPYAYCYRCSYNLTYPSCKLACATGLEDAFRRYVEPEAIAAVVVEPVLGEGGFIVPPKDYFGVLQNVCRKHGILVIADEVQSGMGRTGRYFASEHYELRPDMVVSSKSLAAGMPLAAVIGRSDVMDAPIVGGLGGTFGGNPLSCRAALAALEALRGEGLLERAEAIGARVVDRGSQWLERFKLVGDVRGLGAMVGIELVKDRESKAPANEETQRVAALAAERGLLTITAGTYGNVVRTLMPLVIRDEELEEALDVLESVLEIVERERK
jgi:4-aminobutyrate aminotransferase/(S)-3-amino-2-methylpropionate transaminase